MASHSPVAFRIAGQRSPVPGLVRCISLQPPWRRTPFLLSLFSLRLCLSPPTTRVTAACLPLFKTARWHPWPCAVIASSEFARTAFLPAHRPAWWLVCHQGEARLHRPLKQDTLSPTIELGVSVLALAPGVCAGFPPGHFAPWEVQQPQDLPLAVLRQCGSLGSPSPPHSSRSDEAHAGLPHVGVPPLAPSRSCCHTPTRHHCPAEASPALTRRFPSLRRSLHM